MEPQNKKNIMKLTGMMAAFSRFISKIGEKGLPFFKILKKTEHFKCTSEASKALANLKTYMSTPPILVDPECEEPLLYIAATTYVVNTVMVVEREKLGHAHKVQRPVYYISEVLIDSKIQYTHIQKLLYTILITSRKLHHYFESNHMMIVSNFPLDEILHNRDINGRVVKWSVELEEFNIKWA